LQLALLDVVVEIERELAGIYRASGEGCRVGCESRHFDVAEHYPDIHELGRIEQVDLPHRARQAVVVDLAVEFQLSLRTGARGEPPDRTPQMVDAGPERQQQRVVGKIERAVVKAQTVDIDEKGPEGQPVNVQF